MRKALLLLAVCLPFVSTKSQRVSLSGYVKDMQGVYYLENPVPLVNSNTLQWTTYNQIHNRLNLNWTPTNNLSLEVGMRNRLLAGKMLRDITGYAGMMEQDEGLLDLSHNLVDQPNWFLNTTLDRLYLEYTLNHVQLRVGRQRINWGINLVWNPNDLFNAYSYLDFDYEERPGSDALLFTWYNSATSSLDLAVASDSSRQLRVAGRYVFNVEAFDIQFIGGKNADDAVLGGGFSGSIGVVSLRGEGSCFIPLTRTPGTGTSLSATLSADYTFNNDLFLHAAFLYNGMGASQSGSGLSLLSPSASLSAKNLSMGKYEVFGQLSYPLNPLTQLSLAFMLNPADGSAYIGPMAGVSLHNNLELMLTAQLLTGKPGSEYGFLGNTYTGFARLQWSF